MPFESLLGESLAGSGARVLFFAQVVWPTPTLVVVAVVVLVTAFVLALVTALARMTGSAPPEAAGPPEAFDQLG